MYSEIAANKRRSFFLIVLFTSFVLGVIWLFSYENIQAFGLYSLMAIVYVVVSYLASSKLALSVNGARAIEKKDNPRLYRIVENLAITEGLPMPKVYIMDDPAPNAFATGRNPKNASVCATTGLLDIMTDSELEGVMAHELGHVKNYDIRVSMVAFALVSLVGLIADLLLWGSFASSDDDDDSGGGQLFIFLRLAAVFIAPIVALLIQLAISRRREYLADATGALTTRYPEGLASALEKIGQYGSATSKQHPSTAHLFFANPLRGKGFNSLFSTHPPVADRIAKLRNINSKL